MSKYTAADFANARFAEHESGGYAHRKHNGWVVGSRRRHPDEDMASDGWVPVPTKPTITQSELRNKIKAHGESWANGYHTALTDLGGEVIPDPEPTNTERLNALKEAWMKVLDNRTLAEYLNDHGVTAPNVKGN